jgi:hypothetical protein
VSGILHFLEALYPWYVAYHIPKGFYPIWIGNVDKKIIQSWLNFHGS